MADEKDVMGADEEVMALRGADIPLFKDNMSAPVIFVDAIQGFAVMGGTARFGLVEHRANFQAREVQSIPVGHIIMPLEQVKAWATFFTQVAKRLPDIEGEIAAAADKASGSGQVPDGQ